jgi:hypothetical protein
MTLTLDSGASTIELTVAGDAAEGTAMAKIKSRFPLVARAHNAGCPYPNELTSGVPVTDIQANQA